MTLWLGVDIGGTNTRVGLLGPGGLEAQNRIPTLVPQGPDNWAKRLARAAADLLEGRRASGVGIGCPGTLDRSAGRVEFSSNLRTFDRFGLTAAVSRAVGAPAVLENDANLYALGEARFGAGRGRRDMACVTLGTGVGSGLILGGRLYSGPLGIAGELGHTLAVDGGRPCACGALGCVEAYASATGLAGMLAEALALGRPTRLEHGATVAAMHQAAVQGDALAQEMFDSAGVALGRGIADLVCVLGLDLIIMGGGVSAAWPSMAPAARRELARRVHIIDPARLRVVPAQLGDDAPIMGAAALAAETFGQDATNDNL